jgi:hypothetical protein
MSDTRKFIEFIAEENDLLALIISMAKSTADPWAKLPSDSIKTERGFREGGTS